MKSFSAMMKGRRGCLVLTTVLLAATASQAAAWENPLKKRYLTDSLNICDQGAFHVGGVAKITPYADTNSNHTLNQVIIGQMYVQFQIPKTRKQWPIIMVHGGGFTGSCLEATAEGTEGWLPYAVRNNLATFVVDQAGRGRSSFDSSVLIEAKDTNNASLIPPDLRFTTSNDAWTAWLGHLIPAGSTILDGLLIKHGDPQDPECAANPSHCTFHPTFDFNAVDPKIQAGVGRIGPAPNPANAKQLALDFYKFQGAPYTERTLPTSQCATCTPTTVPQDGTWSGKDLAELVAGLGGAIVATHSQSGAVGHHMVRWLKEAGQLDKLKGLITIEGSCNLASSGLAADGSDFDRIPYLAFAGFYATPSVECQNTVNTINLRRAGGHGNAKAEYVKLSDPIFNGKFRGVTHMMMMHTNNLKVFDVISGWANKNIRNPMLANSCGRNDHDHDDDDDHGHHH